MKISNILLALVLLSGNNLYAQSIPSSIYHVGAGVVATCLSGYLTYVTNNNYIIAQKKFIQVCNQLENMDIAIEKSTTMGLNTARTMFHLKSRNPDFHYNLEQRSIIRDCSQQLVSCSYEKNNQAGYCVTAGMSTIVSALITYWFLNDFLQDLKISNSFKH